MCINTLAICVFKLKGDVPALVASSTTTINLLYASSSNKKVKILHALADSAVLACS